MGNSSPIDSSLPLYIFPTINNVLNIDYFSWFGSDVNAMIPLSVGKSLTITSPNMPPGINSITLTRGSGEHINHLSIDNGVTWLPYGKSINILYRYSFIFLSADVQIIVKVTGFDMPTFLQTPANIPMVLNFFNVLMKNSPNQDNDTIRIVPLINTPSANEVPDANRVYNPILNYYNNINTFNTTLPFYVFVFSNNNLTFNLNKLGSITDKTYNCWIGLEPGQSLILTGSNAPITIKRGSLTDGAANNQTNQISIDNSKTWNSYGYIINLFNNASRNKINNF
jgi:hypothetical protein